MLVACSSVAFGSDFLNVFHHPQDILVVGQVIAFSRVVIAHKDPAWEKLEKEPRDAQQEKNKGFDPFDNSQN